MSGIRLVNLTKNYGALPIVKGIDLDIAPGEFIVLVGPSGCGKTTTLRMIAGLEVASGGDIFLGGRRINTVQPKDRNIAMVFQSYALYPHLSVFDNMAFSLKMRGVAGAELRQAVERAGQALGLTSLLQRKPAELSGGQRQRVAMGRAIVRKPQVFLFDEPLSNLDAKLRIDMRTEVKRLHQQLKITSVYVTHDQIEAMTLADRIVVMNGGRIEQVGTPLALYDRPANMFVAGFIGAPSMNFLKGRIAGGVFRAADGAAMPLPPGGAPMEGRPVVYGIRPEHLRLADDGIALTVEVVEPTGSETQVFMNLGSQPMVGAFRERIAAQPEETLRVLPDLGSIHLFDEATGHRLG